MIARSGNMQIGADGAGEGHRGLIGVEPELTRRAQSTAEWTSSEATSEAS